MRQRALSGLESFDLRPRAAIVSLRLPWAIICRAFSFGHQNPFFRLHDLPRFYFTDIVCLRENFSEMRKIKLPPLREKRRHFAMISAAWGGMPSTSVMFPRQVHGFVKGSVLGNDNSGPTSPLQGRGLQVPEGVFRERFSHPLSRQGSLGHGRSATRFGLRETAAIAACNSSSVAFSGCD